MPDRKVKELRSALAPIPADDYETWLEIGMSLHSIGAGPQAFGLWTEWSQTSPKYDPAVQAQKWKSFNGTGGITLSTLFAAAKRHGWVEPRTATVPGQPHAAQRPRNSR